MAPIYEYECSTCGQYYEEYASMADFDKPIPCECGELAERVISSAPALVSSSTWSAGPFHPHFDEQLGMHFDTKKEKTDYLKKKGLVQIEGPSSPEAPNPSRPKMSQSQAMDFDGNVIKRNQSI